MRLTTSISVSRRPRPSAISCGRSLRPAFHRGVTGGNVLAAGRTLHPASACRQHDMAVFEADVFLHEHGIGAIGASARR